MSSILSALSQVELFVLSWGVRLVGVLGMILALMFVVWKVIERILRWANVYVAFREWYWAKICREQREKRSTSAKKEGPQ